MQHRGEIVEKAVRTRISISEFARRLQVSRRTIYNWFGQDDLRIDIIERTGVALKYDFSLEFPNMFLNPTPKVLETYSNEEYKTGDATFWKDKYNVLLAIHQDMILASREFHA